MNEANVTKFKRLIAELFMFDQANLDFGIYRIMNTKRAEIQKFLDEDLIPQIRAELQVLGTEDLTELEAELKKTIQQLRDYSVPSAAIEQSGAVITLREKIEDAKRVVEMENEIYDDLYDFFRRYYASGDYLALRRYKEGVYAIPYEGEEVKLHWANADQYYIKSTEHFRDYTFKLHDGRRVHFKLVEADTEQNNNKPTNGNERRFMLCDGEAIVEQGGELYLCFEYKPDPDKRTQADLNAAARERIFATTGMIGWIAELARALPTDSDPTRTLLDKYLTDYTARNTFDYFIHKDVGAFLRRELDFFVKTEIMHLDDVENADEKWFSRYRAHVKAFRKVARKIIDFLAQLENFQKKLWLKKKFVIETNYCVTLDRVPEVLYPEIAANDAQREEWVRLFAIDEISGDLVTPGYSVPLTVEFLQVNMNLLVDTRFFGWEFRSQLLAYIDNFDEQVDGLLIHSDNFQALQLVQTRFQEQVKCIYIDPPYNTASSSIPYKNDYKHSSWASMMRDRLALLREIMATDAAIFVSIDKTERTVLEHVLDNVFGSENRIEELIWSMNTNNSQAPNYSTNHEYVEVYARNRAIVEQDPNMFREPKPGYEEVMALVARLNPNYPPISEVETELRNLYSRHKIEYLEELDAQGLNLNGDDANDPWKGIFNYNRAEYRDETGRLVSDSDAREKQSLIWVWQEGDASMPATKQASSTRDPDHPNWRFYKPLHPVTGKPCPHPKSGWKFAYANDDESPDRRSFLSLDRDNRIAWGVDENKVPRIKRMLHEVETNIGKSVFQDYSDGEKQTSAMFGISGVFLAPKHADFVSRFILQSATPDSVVVDCFGGSGSTAHAVIKLNREDRGKRKYALVEVGEYFDTVLKPRVLKAVYSVDWKAGKPVSRQGISHCIKYLNLESYEDALNNLRLTPLTNPQQAMLALDFGVREDYVLRYMLDVESRPSLLNIERLEEPFDFQMDIGTGTVGETRRVNVDVVETFNYLIGLRVRRMRAFAGVRAVEGELANGQRVLILWRSFKQVDNDALDAFFQREYYGADPLPFDLVYVNGENFIANLRRDDEVWSVRLIEEDFFRLMFDVQDV